MIIKIDKRSKEIVERIDINQMDGRGHPLGWCRGLYIEGRYAYVGFSKLRDSKAKENIRWVKNYIRGNVSPLETLPARIVKIDLWNKEIIDEYIFPEGHLDVVFSILSAG